MMSEGEISVYTGGRWKVNLSKLGFKRKFKVTVCLALVFAFSFTPFNTAATDDFVMRDPVQNTYVGRADAKNYITFSNYDDVPGNHPYRQAIARGSALNLFKGNGGRAFNPEQTVTNEMAIVFILQLFNFERRALELDAEVRSGLQADARNVSAIWSLGYLALALELELIDADEYANSLLANPGGNARFNRNAPALRENVAFWLYKALLVSGMNVFDDTRPLSKVYTFADWMEIDRSRLIAVEEITYFNVMMGDGTRFFPKGTLTRAEMAQAIVNLDTIYLRLKELEKKTGTVGAIIDNFYHSASDRFLWRNFYVRTTLGTVDMLRFELHDSASPQSGTRDCVVYKNGMIGGMELLERGDLIEYIVKNGTGEGRAFIHLRNFGDADRNRRRRKRLDKPTFGRYLRKNHNCQARKPVRSVQHGGRYALAELCRAMGAGDRQYAGTRGRPAVRQQPDT
jgi:hypothetical protein